MPDPHPLTQRLVQLIAEGEMGFEQAEEIVLQALPADEQEGALAALTRLEAMRRAVSPSTVDDMEASASETLVEALRTRPVQFLTKAAVAGIPGLKHTEMPLPLGEGEMSRKTPFERLMFEVGLAADEVKGRKLEDLVQALRARRDAEVKEESPASTQRTSRALDDFLSGLR